MPERTENAQKSLLFGWNRQCKLLPSDRIAYFVSGPNSIAKSVIEPDNNGRYTVYYTPVEVGLYSIAIKWNGKEIEGKWVSAYFWMSPCAVCSLHHRLIVHIFKSQLAWFVLRSVSIALGKFDDHLNAVDLQLLSILWTLIISKLKSADRGVESRGSIQHGGRSSFSKRLELAIGR